MPSPLTPAELAADTAALADGCCLQVPGGIVVPVAVPIEPG